MKPDDLPLFDLFNELRQAGLLLGINEYELLLYALQSGFGIEDLAALSRLCQTLWVKSKEDVATFNYCFKQVMVQANKNEASFSTKEVSQSESTPFFVSDGSASIADAATSQVVSTEMLDLSFKSDDEVLINLPSSYTAHMTNEDLASHFIVSDEYFPITRRGMKQSWRYLRRPLREGAPVELDVEATIAAITYQGYVLEPVLVPLRINTIELLLLVDQGGSMVPFHILSRRLIETALHGGPLGKIHIYYFHNYPKEYLYHDPTCVQGELVKNILRQLCKEQTSILIISDAGAARERYNLKRSIMTEEFIDQLKRHFLYLAWLNPMPRSRWSNTTAEDIMEFIPMLEIDRKGVDDAIQILCGRDVHARITI